MGSDLWMAEREHNDRAFGRLAAGVRTTLRFIENSQSGPQETLDSVAQLLREALDRTEFKPG